MSIDIFMQEKLSEITYNIIYTYIIKILNYVGISKNNISIIFKSKLFIIILNYYLIYSSYTVSNIILLFKIK